jgi:hypothetical protein
LDLRVSENGDGKFLQNLALGGDLLRIPLLPMAAPPRNAHAGSIRPFPVLHPTIPRMNDFFSSIFSQPTGLRTENGTKTTFLVARRP